MLKLKITQNRSLKLNNIYAYGRKKSARDDFFSNLI